MKYFCSFLLLFTVMQCPGQSNKKASGIILRNTGNAHYAQGNYDSAAYYYDTAAVFFTGLGQQAVLVNNYIRLGNYYVKQKQYDKAIKFYNKVILYTPKTGTRRTLMAALKQVGLLYEAKSNYQVALDYYRQSFNIADSLDFVKKIQQNTPEVYSHNFMASVMGSIKQKNTTPGDILKTIENKRALNDTLALSINYFNLGMLYKMKRMYAPSLNALQRCLQYATKIHYTDMRISASNEMADLYERVGNYRQSLVYFKKRMALNALRDNSKTIGELQTKYEIIQREDQLLRQQFEITKRNYWVAGISVFILLMFVIGFIYYKQMQLKQRNVAMQAIIETEESERRRIARDLHDGVSQTISAAKINLTVIGGELPFVNDDQKKRFNRVIGMVDDGFKEVRTISHNMMPWALRETGLAKVIKQFISNIESDAIKIHFFSKGFEVPFDNTTDIILYRILQESVNNVMKHAQASMLDISLIRDDDNISMTIEDNGKGFDTTNPDVYKGMGLSNLQSRINFLKGKVELDSQPGKGTLISVYIPLGG